MASDAGVPRVPARSAGRHQGHRPRARRSPPAPSIAPCTASPRSARRRGRACSAWRRRWATGRISPRATCSRASSCASPSTCRGRIALFWDSLREGIREAAAPFAPALHVEFHAYPSLGDGDIPLFEEALRDGTNGLIIAPGNPAALAPHLRKAARRHIPVVCVVTDAPESPAPDVGLGRSVHGRRGRRRTAGEIPARRRRGGVLHRMAGDAGSRRQAARIRVEPEGDRPRPHASVPIVEAHDDEREAHRRALRRAARASGLEGDLRQHGELAAGPARRRTGGAPRRD